MGILSLLTANILRQLRLINYGLLTDDRGCPGSTLPVAPAERSADAKKKAQTKKRSDGSPDLRPRLYRHAL
jgi:hypothetical protein